MIIAVQVFCALVALISTIGFIAEKSPVYLAGAFGFTLLVVIIQTSFK